MASLARRLSQARPKATSKRIVDASAILAPPLSPSLGTLVSRSSSSSSSSSSPSSSSKKKSKKAPLSTFNQARKFATESARAKKEAEKPDWRKDPLLLSKLQRMFEEGKLNDVAQLPKDIRDAFGEEKLKEVIEEFNYRQSEAKKKGKAQLFLENLEALERQDEAREKKEREEDGPDATESLKNAHSLPFWLGLLLMLYFATKHIMERQKEEAKVPPKETMWTESTVDRLKYFPTRYFSQLWGAVTSYPFPTPVQKALNWMYARMTGCIIEEAEKDPAEYKTLQAWFQRHLKPGVRPLDDSALLISPVDGRVVHYGFVDEDNGTIEQVKGVSYSLTDFVGTDSPLHDVLKRMRENKKSDTDLYYCVLYLAPGDYHGYHSPTDLTIHSRSHFPGHLFPVAAWAVRFIRNLFPLNERVVLTGSWKHGFFAYAPVGAYNVGSIELNFEPTLKTNLPDQNASSPSNHLTYPAPITLRKGDNIGFFNLGSSIVMIFEAPTMLFKVARGEKVRLGQALTAELTPELAREQLKRIEGRRATLEQQLREELQREAQEQERLQEYLDRVDKFKERAREKAAERVRNNPSNRAA